MGDLQLTADALWATDNNAGDTAAVRPCYRPNPRRDHHRTRRLVFVGPDDRSRMALAHHPRGSCCPPAQPVNRRVGGRVSGRLPVHHAPHRPGRRRWHLRIFSTVAHRRWPRPGRAAHRRLRPRGPRSRRGRCRRRRCCIRGRGRLGARSPRQRVSEKGEQSSLARGP